MCALGSHEMTRPPSGNSMISSMPWTGGQQVAVRELHALGRPGRARGVDQRQDVVGLERGDRRVDVEGRRRRPRPRRAPSCPRARRRRRRSRARGRAASCAPPGHWPRKACSVMRILAPGVGDHVLDLVGRVGHVDRERRRADHHRREVGEVELGPVAEHQRDRVALRRPSAVQAAGERVDALAQLAPRPATTSSPFVRTATSSARCGGGDPERLGDRRRVDPALRVPVLLSIFPTPLSDVAT